MSDDIDSALRVHFRNLLLPNKVTTKDNWKNNPQETCPQTADNDRLKKIPCRFSYRGCKMTFTTRSAQENHEKECAKRKYHCEGKTFCGWECEWTGYYEDIWKHFEEKHKEHTLLPHHFFLDTTLRFDKDFTDLQLIQKRNKLFWYKHRVMSDKNNGYWLCQYVGPSEEASTYGYEFVVTDDKRKLQISELCSSDSEAVEELFQKGLCVTVPQLVNFVRGKDRLKISVQIKKRPRR